jgi:hypothetical protein
MTSLSSRIATLAPFTRSTTIAALMGTVSVKEVVAWVL